MRVDSLAEAPGEAARAPTSTDGAHGVLRRSLSAAATALIIAVSCGSDQVTEDLAGEVARAEPGAVIHVAPGRYAGPVVIDKSITLLGVKGVVIESPPLGIGLEIINAKGVVVSELQVEGGSIGIRIWRSEDVTLSGLTVVGAARHGILVENGQAEITDCRVEGMTLGYARGIEVRNSDLHPATEVSGCTVVGPVFEGIVARLSHVSFTGNTVTRATETGIAITEMSAGTLSSSDVNGGTGAGILCGDMSMCEILDNTVIGIGDAETRRSTRGHGVVVQYHSVAVIERLETSGLAGERVMTSLGGVVNEE